MESYDYRGISTANVIAEVRFAKKPSRRYLLGAHYDSVSGTVGADDNASAVAVQLEVARRLASVVGRGELDLAVKFVSFTLEEPPAFLSPQRGSRVHARNARRTGEQIDGMICLEMVGYTCDRPGCQRYPWPLSALNYPRKGDFIGIVGDFQSAGFARALHRSFQGNPELPVLKQIVPFRGWLLPSVRRSDHASFWDCGYKAVMITDTAFFRNPHYHKSSDTMETLDLSFMAQLVESLLLFFLSAR
jgi:Zn-dependent M28 family amino/carboxypeptidase